MFNTNGKYTRRENLFYLFIYLYSKVHGKPSNENYSSDFLQRQTRASDWNRTHNSRLIGERSIISTTGWPKKTNIKKYNIFEIST